VGQFEILAMCLSQRKGEYLARVVQSALGCHRHAEISTRDRPLAVVDNLAAAVGFGGGLLCRGVLRRQALPALIQSAFPSN
jgi:hypothetical protein